MKSKPWDKSTVAARLCRLADAHGMWEADVVRFEDILQQVNLTKEEITNEVIERAVQLRQQWRASIRNKVEAFNNRNKPAKRKVKKGTLKRAIVRNGKPRPFGFPVTSILRWLGDQGFTEWDAMLLLEHWEITIASSTIKAQLRAGRIGDRGEPAELSAKQEEEIRTIIRNEKC